MESMPKKQHKTSMLGVYLGGNDADLISWKASCQGDYDVTPSAFAKEAIREKISRAKGYRTETITMKQIARVLNTHLALLHQILSFHKKGNLVQTQPDETQRHAPVSRQTDYLSACQQLGWGKKEE
jgi:hypothetical protein